MTITITEQEVNTSFGTGKNNPVSVVYVASLDCVFALCSDCILKFTDPHNNLATFTSASLTYGTTPAANNELIWVASKSKLYAAGGYLDGSSNAHAILFEITPSDLSSSVVCDRQLGDVYPTVASDGTYFYLATADVIARFNHGDFAYVSQISLSAYSITGISRLKHESGKLYLCTSQTPSKVATIDTATFAYEASAEATGTVIWSDNFNGGTGYLEDRANWTLGNGHIWEYGHGSNVLVNDHLMACTNDEIQYTRVEAAGEGPYALADADPLNADCAAVLYVKKAANIEWWAFGPVLRGSMDDQKRMRGYTFHEDGDDGLLHMMRVDYNTEQMMSGSENDISDVDWTTYRTLIMVIHTYPSTAIKITAYIDGVYRGTFIDVTGISEKGNAGIVAQAVTQGDKMSYDNFSILRGVVLGSKEFAFAGNYLYLANYSTNGDDVAYIKKSDLTDNNILSTGVYYQTLSAYSPDGSFVYAGTNTNPGKLIIVDSGNGNSVSSYTFSAGASISSIHQGSDSSELFVVHKASPGAISRLGVTNESDLQVQLQDDLNA